MLVREGVSRPAGFPSVGGGKPSFAFGIALVGILCVRNVKVGLGSVASRCVTVGESEAASSRWRYRHALTGRPGLATQPLRWSLVPATLGSESRSTLPDDTTTNALSGGVPAVRGRSCVARRDGRVACRGGQECGGRCPPCLHPGEAASPDDTCPRTGANPGSPCPRWTPPPSPPSPPTHKRRRRRPVTHPAVTGHCLWMCSGASANV